MLSDAKQNINKFNDEINEQFKYNLIVDNFGSVKKHEFLFVNVDQVGSYKKVDESKKG